MDPSAICRMSAGAVSSVLRCCCCIAALLHCCKCRSAMGCLDSIAVMRVAFNHVTWVRSPIEAFFHSCTSQMAARILGKRIFCEMVWQVSPKSDDMLPSEVAIAACWIFDGNLHF